MIPRLRKSRMTSLVNHIIRINLSFSIRRFVSSVAILEDPSIASRDNETKTHAFDPFQFFADEKTSRNCTLQNTKILHALLLRRALVPFDVFLSNSVLGWYTKSGYTVDALKLFGTIPQRNVVSWNTLISGCNLNSMFEDSWKFFRYMHSAGFEPNDFTYGSVLSACTALQAPVLGYMLFSIVTKNGCSSSGYVRTGLIDLFVKDSRFDDALRVFRDVPSDNLTSWNAMIGGGVIIGEYRVALELFREMCSVSLVPNAYTFPSVLTACAALKEAQLGKTVHGLVIKFSKEDVFVGTALTDFYSKCGDMVEAVKVFSRIPDHNVVSWTAMISGFVKKDDAASALRIFNTMISKRVEINKYTVTSLLAACSNPSMIYEAMQIHTWALKTGLYIDSAVSASLINVYSKLGYFYLSEAVFDDVDVIKGEKIWSAMVSASAQNQRPKIAIDLFRRKFQEGLQPDAFSISSLLSVIESLNLGSQIHGYNLKTGLLADLSVSSSLFTMYSKCGSLDDSFKVFEKISARDNVSWASMITGFVEHGYPDRAIQLFQCMLHEGSKPDDTTLSAALAACSALPSPRKGKEIHAYSVHANIQGEKTVGPALVNMYAKCGSLAYASRVFNRLREKDEISCSSLVSGYCQNGLINEALSLFSEMMKSDLGIDSFTISSILVALALSDKSECGIQFQSLLVKIGLEREASVGSSLVTMYSKFGSLEDCCKAFDQIEDPDLIAWTSLITSYAQHGKGMEALRAYDLMRQNGIQPDKVAFVGVLSACSHSGLVDEAYGHLNSMVKEYGMEPSHLHYACMVDVLGRSGRLKEAERFINSMPIESDALVWGTLLCACKVHGDIKLGKLAARKVIELEPSDAGAYVSLSNILAEIGQWEEVEETRKLLKGMGVEKEPGWSFV